MLFSETEFVERPDEPGEFLEGEDWLGANMDGPHIQQGAVHSPLSAGPGDFGQNFPALLYFDAAFCAESDEFAGPDNL